MVRVNQSSYALPDIEMKCIVAQAIVLTCEAKVGC